jgi:hypothetical protein
MDGSVAQLCEFRKALATADSNISLDWTYKSQKQAKYPIVVEACEHERAIVLELDMYLKCRCLVLLLKWYSSLI